MPVLKHVMKIREHNKEAYEAVKRSFSHANRTCVVMPTGTGKSYVALQLMRDNMDKNILFLTSQNGALGHFIDLAKDELGYDAFDTALYASVKKLPRAKKYDYIILDEFHRCGADVWGENTLNIIERNKDAKILGLSATPIRFLDDMRNMAEELFESNVAYEMKLSEAIAAGILQWPYYAVGVINLENEVKRLEAKFKAGPKAHDKRIAVAIKTAKRKIHEAGGMPEFFKEHLVKPTGHYLVFCSNIEKLNEYFSKAKEWFIPVVDEIHIYSVHSQKVRNEETIEKFLSDKTEDTLKLLFCVDMLNEGLHADEIDGVIMLRSTESPNVYLQQLGRALSVSSKTMPLVLDVVDNMTCFSIVETVKKEIKEILKNSNSSKRFHFAISSEIRNIITELQNIEKSLEFTWDEWYALAKAYYKEYGNLLVPALYETKEYIKLGFWISNQRKAYSVNALSEDKIKKLESIGMIWSIGDFAWEHKYSLAVNYYYKYGNLLVPENFVIEGEKLGKWIGKQRYDYSLEKLSSERIQRLETIGMIWNIHNYAWDKNYTLAKKYYEEHGDLLIHRDYEVEGVKLGSWISKQRTQYNDSKLTDEQIKKLEAIGMVWSLRSRHRCQSKLPYKRSALAWERNFAAARKYYKRNGNLLVPSEYKEGNISLGRWISIQRTYYSKGKLSSAKIEKLEAVGMIWDLREMVWESNYVLAKEYFSIHGNLRISRNYVVNDIKLGIWIENQKRAHKEGSLTNDRIKRLEAIGIVWWGEQHRK